MVDRMRILRPILAALVSVGLVLAPMPVAHAMGSMWSSMTPDAAHTAKSTLPTKDSCPCCGVGKCFAAAICKMSCAQLGPASDVNFRAAPIGHAALRGIVPGFHQGLTQHPPTPPPRV